MSNGHYRKLFLLAHLAILIAISILILIYRYFIVDHLRVFIGSLMLTYGLEEVGFELLFLRKHMFKHNKLYMALVEVIFGVFLLASDVIMETTCIIWASWAIFREAFEIRELVVEVKSITLKIISGIESVTVIVLSLMLILEAGEHHALIHLYLLLAELILIPLVPLADEIIDEFRHKKSIEHKAEETKEETIEEE